MEGYIQIHRKMEDSIVFQDPYYLKLWMWLLFRARYKAGEVLIGRQKVYLEVGQLIWGRKEASEILNKGLRGKSKKSESTWENYLKDLEKLGKLNRKVNSKFTIVTIENYGYYQNLDDEISQQTKQPFNSNLTTTSQQVNSNLTQKNKDNKDNTVNKDNKALRFSPPTTFNNNNINVHEKIEQEFGRPLSPIELETITAWLNEDEYDPKLIQVALREAVLNQAYSLKYIDRILLSWERKGITSESAALAHLNKRNERSVSKSQSFEILEDEDLPVVPLYNWLNPEESEGVTQ